MCSSDLNRQKSDAQTFLLKTITAVLTGATKKFLSAGVAYSWQLKQGLLRLQAIEQQLQPIYQNSYRSIRNQLVNSTCSDILGKSVALRDEMDKIARDVQTHLEGTRNFSVTMNATRPKPIMIEYVPELTNLSVHKSGKRMREAFEDVIKHPTQAIEGTITKMLGFFDDIFEHPLKIIMGLGLIIILFITVTAITRTCYKRHNRSVEDKAYAMVAKIGKSTHI